MLIRKATSKEVKFACQRFHYAKKAHCGNYQYSIFNDEREWCGVIIFADGANLHYGDQFGLIQGELLELVRVALNGKQECTSQCVAAAMRQLHKDAPRIKMLISYADTGQGHLGTIYQATNWFYLGVSKATVPTWIIKGKSIHNRTKSRSYGSKTLEEIRETIDPNASIIEGTDKHKYVYFYDKKLKKKFLHLAKPYPKRETGSQNADTIKDGTSLQAG